jgi:Flp pilus assembly protein TadB
MLALGYPRALSRAGAQDRLAGLSGELAATADDRERVILVNDWLAEIEHELVARAWLPRTAAWLSVVGALLALVTGLIAAPGLELLGCVVFAVGGAGSCLAVERLGRRRARAVRKAIDARIRTLAGPLYDAEIVLVAPRRRRRRR